MPILYMAVCRSCPAMFLQVSWLEWRVAGYCCAKCYEPFKPKAKEICEQGSLL